MRDGQRHFLTGLLPVCTKPQKRHRDPVSHELMRAKVLKVRKQGYVCPGVVTSGTHYFSVPKGLDDNRMVNNGTSCGLNDAYSGPQGSGCPRSSRLCGRCWQDTCSVTLMWGSSSLIIICMKSYVCTQGWMFMRSDPATRPIFNGRKGKGQARGNAGSKIGWV